MTTYLNSLDWLRKNVSIYSVLYLDVQKRYVKHIMQKGENYYIKIIEMPLQMHNLLLNLI